MKFLTPELVHGDYDAKESQRRWKQYRDYLAEITPNLPPEVATLSEIEVHDGKISRIVWKPTKRELTILLRCGWGVIGYFDLNLCYHDVVMTRRNLGALKAITARDYTELMAQEIDHEGDNGIHRLLFVTGSRWRRHRRRYGYAGGWHEEICITFRSLELTQVPRANRNIGKRQRRFIIMP
jgi:hypothetical protein